MLFIGVFPNSGRCGRRARTTQKSRLNNGFDQLDSDKLTFSGEARVKFGASDGDANPIHYFYSLGLGGKGIVAGRPRDSFGLGGYYIDVSNPTITTVLRQRTFSFLRDEYGLEAYYDAAITPWMYFTPDIQVVRPAQKREARSSNEIDTDLVVGFRLRMIF